MTGEQTHSRIDLAREQLDVAMCLFLDKRSYASAITLAGAAEEVFGKELRRQGKQSAFDWKIEEISKLHKSPFFEELDRKSFADEENRMRNALKHFNKEDAPEITCDLESAACWMLVRACQNADMLDQRIARVTEFNNWFYEHVVGI